MLHKLKFFLLYIFFETSVFERLNKIFRSQSLYASFTYAMTSITEKPIIRDYQLGTCYMCQICLTCSKDLAFDTCECNITEKPKAPKASKRSKGAKRMFYSRVYDSNNMKSFSHLQISKLKECDEYFGYYSDFDGYFQLFLCVKCHSKLTRLKHNNTTKITKLNSDSCDSTPLSTSPSSQNSQNVTEDSVYSDSDHDDDIIEFNFKLVIKPDVGKAKPAKWESFEALSLAEFEDEILELVQNQHDHLIRKSDYTVIYKQSSSHGAGTLLADEKDWRRFLPDYKKILSIKKDLIIIIEIKEKSNKIKRR